MKATHHGAKNLPELTLVTGGTGKTGRRIVERLRARGVPVRVASRGAVPAFDWNEPGSWEASLAGASTVYISYSPDLAVPGATAIVRAFVARALEQGVRRLVLLSGRGEAEAEACEAIVRNAGVDWTIVRASWFNQNFSEGEFAGMVLDGVMPLPAGDIPEPFVDVNDIADVAVAALAEDGHAGEVYELTGPRLLSFADVAAELSQATGHEIRYLPISRDEFTTGLAAAGMPQDMTWLLDYLFTTVLDGRNASVRDGVQRALGRAPKDFAEFARQVAQSGAWNAPEPRLQAAS